jgi:hypothetical protein
MPQAPVPETAKQAADKLMSAPEGGELHSKRNRSSSFGAFTGPGTAPQSAAKTADGAGDQAMRAESPVSGILAVDQARPAPGGHGLPSGLRAVSAVANARQVVAIDSGSTLFFSNDAGAHWNVITPPWHGRAVKVELVPTSRPAVIRNSAVAAAPAAIVGGIAERPKAALTGEITDVSGASIPGASVAVTNSLTQAVRRTTTDPSGHYTVDQLEPGTYTLHAEAPGFKSQQIPGLTLNPTQQNQMNVTLAVGAMAESVEVQGQAPLALATPKITQKSSDARTAASPVARFEVTTDAGEHWISSDGRSWQRKAEDK